MRMGVTDGSTFTRKTLSFLRSLKRNNDRDWFRERRDDYDRHVRAPMVAVIEQLGHDLKQFAPELETSPKKCLYRIYRDTRFSADKSPLKTHVAASFRQRGLSSGEGAGLYFEVAPGWVWIGGGFYAPETAHLVKIRERIASTHPELHRLAHAAPFRRAFGTLDGERLTRVPRGFPRDHPAADYLKFRSFLAGREFPAEFAISPAFYPSSGTDVPGRHAHRAFSERIARNEPVLEDGAAPGERGGGGSDWSQSTNGAEDVDDRNRFIILSATDHRLIGRRYDCLATAILKIRRHPQHGTWRQRHR